MIVFPFVQHGGQGVDIGADSAQQVAAVVLQQPRRGEGFEVVICDEENEIFAVIYTERRYVRKPRKAPAGTAVCLREKSLFVAPEVAPGVEGI